MMEMSSIEQNENCSHDPGGVIEMYFYEQIAV
jgi:hypothetical protein